MMDIESIVGDKLMMIAHNREALMEAFLAEHEGLKPSEVVMKERRYADEAGFHIDIWFEKKVDMDRVNLLEKEIKTLKEKVHIYKLFIQHLDLAMKYLSGKESIL